MDNRAQLRKRFVIDLLVLLSRASSSRAFSGIERWLDRVAACVTGAHKMTFIRRSRRLDLRSRSSTLPMREKDEAFCDSPKIQQLRNVSLLTLIELPTGPRFHLCNSNCA